MRRIVIGVETITKGVKRKRKNKSKRSAQAEKRGEWHIDGKAERKEAERKEAERKEVHVDTAGSRSTERQDIKGKATEARETRGVRHSVTR